MVGPGTILVGTQRVRSQLNRSGQFQNGFIKFAFFQIATAEEIVRSGRESLEVRVLRAQVNGATKIIDRLIEAAGMKVGSATLVIGVPQCKKPDRFAEISDGF